MKKVQRSFAVEYKSGRRRSDANSNSIWGNVDLKSVARAVEEEAMPFAPNEQQHGKSIEDVTRLADDTAKAMLTPPISQHSTEAVKEETDMADENNAMTKTEAAAVVETPIAEKKQRKPRAKKIAPDATAVEAVSDNASPFWATMVRWLTVAWSLNTAFILLFLQVDLLMRFARG